MYNITQAKAKLEKLLKEVAAGKEVIIARRNKPIAKIVPFRRAGSLKGKLEFDPKFFDPLTPQELKD